VWDREQFIHSSGSKCCKLLNYIWDNYDVEVSVILSEIFHDQMNSEINSLNTRFLASYYVYIFFSGYLTYNKVRSRSSVFTWAKNKQII
jgi:hypothetical protein